MKNAGAYGQQLGKAFHLARAPALVSRVLCKTQIAVTEIKCDAENNGLTDPIAREDAFLVTVQLRECPRHELWIDDRPVATSSLGPGAVSIYDLRRNPVVRSISPFHSLHFYLPRRALDAVAELEGIPNIGEFDNRPGSGTHDETIYRLGLSLLPSLDCAEEANRMFVDHLTVAAVTHVLHAHGGAGSAPARAASLGRSREHRVKELIAANLNGDVAVTELARECGLSVGAFVCAFRRSTGMVPHQWLDEMRIARAKKMLTLTDFSLAEIAPICGFASARHLVRAFTQSVGVHPSRWTGRTRQPDIRA